MLERLVQNGHAGKVSAIILDCTDFSPLENSISSELFTPQFYKNIHTLLAPGCEFVQKITKTYYLDAFTERVNAGGFEKVGILNVDVPECGGVLPLAHCIKK